jgi:hypothetical protein
MELEFTQNEIEILDALTDWCQSFKHGARPMDLGGHNGTHHSATLNKLIRRGLVERTRRTGGSDSRGAYRYRLTKEAQVNG